MAHLLSGRRIDQYISFFTNIRVCLDSVINLHSAIAINDLGEFFLSSSLGFSNSGSSEQYQKEHLQASSRIAEKVDIICMSH